MYRGYQDGFLPFDGALTDQPNNLVECMTEISSTKAYLDKEDMDKENSGNDDNGSGFRSVLSE